MVREKWKYDISKEEVKSLFPRKQIEKILEKEVELLVFRDDEVLEDDIVDYNMAVAARAHNDSMKSRLRKFYSNFYNSSDFKNKMKVELPQIKCRDNFENTLITLHFSKLNYNELFINDVALFKNSNEKETIGKGVFSKILSNLESIASKQEINIISGYSTNQATYENVFKNHGFKLDDRRIMGNDYLLEQSKKTGAQVPFYKNIVKN